MQFQRVWHALFCALITLSSGDVIAMNRDSAMNSCFIEFRVNSIRVHSCSGTAVSGKMLLTAGHCILFGSVYLNADDYNTVVRCPHNPETEYSVIKAYMHPYFDKYLVNNSRSGLPLAIANEFDKLQLKTQGMDPNIDIGFMEIESSKSFPGPFAKLALSKADFDNAIKNECYTRGYRGDFLKKEAEFDITSSIFFRRIFDFRKSTNDKYGLTVATDPKESYIFQGDSGSSVVCRNRLDNTETIVATVSGALSPVVSIFQNANFIKMIMTERTIPEEWTVPSSFNRELLDIKREIYRKSDAIRKKGNVTVICNTVIVAELKICKHLVDNIERLIESINPNHKFVIEKKVIQFRNRKNYSSDGLPVYNEVIFLIPNNDDEWRNQGYNLYTEEKLMRFLLSRTSTN